MTISFETKTKATHFYIYKLSNICGRLSANSYFNEIFTRLSPP